MLVVVFKMSVVPFSVPSSEVDVFLEQTHGFEPPLKRTQTHIDSKILQKNSYRFLERVSFIKQVFFKSLLSSTSAMFVCQATEFHFRRDFHLRRGLSTWQLCRRVGGCADELVVVPSSW